MSSSALLFNPSQGIRLRAQPTVPLRPWTGPSSCCLYRRDVVQRFLAIKSEANKGMQSRRNSKSNSNDSSDDSRKEQIMSFLKKIEASIKNPSAVEPKERSMAEQKKQHLDPKSYDKRNFSGHTKSSGPPSNRDKLTREDSNRSVAPPRDNIKYSGPPPSFAKLTRDDGNRDVAPPRDNINPSGPLSNFAELTRDDGNKVFAPPHDDKKPSGPLPNFAKLTRDEGNKVVAPPDDDKKYSGPLSNFDKLIRDGGKNVDNKSSGPLSIFDALPRNGGKILNKKISLPRTKFDKLKRKGGNYDFAFLRNDKKSPGPPSNFDILIRDGGDNAVSTPQDYKPPRPTSRFVRRSPIPISNPTKEETKTIPKDQPPSVIVRDTLEQEMSGSDEMPVVTEKEDPLKSELEVEPTSELEAMTVSELRDIAKARGLKGYSKCKKAKLVEILKGASL